jgi:hypothetical protein
MNGTLKTAIREHGSYLMRNLDPRSVGRVRGAREGPWPFHGNAHQQLGPRLRDGDTAALPHTALNPARRTAGQPIMARLLDVAIGVVTTLIVFVPLSR